MITPAMVLDALKGVAGAATELQNVLTALPNQITAFVEAFSPAAVEQFQLALGDFMATLGVALEPVLSAFTELTRAVADYLLPVMQELRPVVQQLAGEFLQRMVPVVQMAAGLLKDLMPLLQVFLDITKALTPVFNALAVVVGALARTFVQFIASLFGDDYKDAMKAFQDAMRKLANQLLIFVGQMAALFGSTGFLKNLMAGLTPNDGRGNSGGLKAAQNPLFKSFVDYGRDVSLAASVAGGQKTEYTQAEFFKEALGELKKIAADPQTFQERLLALIRELPTEIAKKIRGGVGSAAEQALDTARDATPWNPASPLAEAFFSLIYGPRGG